MRGRKGFIPTKTNELDDIWHARPLTAWRLFVGPMTTRCPPHHTPPSSCSVALLPLVSWLFGVPIADRRSAGHSALCWLLGAILATRRPPGYSGFSWLLGCFLIPGRSRLTDWSLGGHASQFWLLDALVSFRGALINLMPFCLFGAIPTFRRPPESSTFPWLSVSHRLFDDLMITWHASRCSVSVAARPI